MIPRSLVATVAGAALVLATAGIAHAKTVPDKQYAEAYCDAYEQALDDMNGVETEAQAGGDATAFQSAALTAVDGVLASLETAATNLQDLAPKDGGKKVAKLFEEALATFTAGIQSARDEFAAVDPGSGAFSEAVGTLLVASVAGADTFDQPLAELGKHKKLRRAVRRSCDIVRVTRS